MTAPRPLLSLQDVTTQYGKVLALRRVSLEVPVGKILALLGPNGAGKTTTLRAVSGLLEYHGGRVTEGSILFDGVPLPTTPSARVRGGISQVLEGRRIFQDLSIEENLVAGSFTVRSRAQRSDALERIYGMFPILRERRAETAGYLSGGQQQMVAIGRALMSRPRLLLLDEPSLGLAPKIVEQIAETILSINAEGASILLVEQNAAVALRIAHQAVIMETGRVALSGASSALQQDAKVREVYLGMAGSVDRADDTAMPPSGNRR
jgi:branched-chain amino acid transport system ATP-binding protein